MVAAYGSPRRSLRRILPTVDLGNASGSGIRIVLEGLRGEDSIAELCRREGIVQNLYYRWSKDFLEAGKKRLAGDTARAATSDEVKELRREAANTAGAVGSGWTSRTSMPDGSWARASRTASAGFVLDALEQALQRMAHRRFVERVKCHLRFKENDIRKKSFHSLQQHVRGTAQVLLSNPQR